MDRKTPLIVITGPTGSGKTGLALELAGTYPIEVISADSMQIYRYMDIATAKPDEQERSLLPHHLIDVVDPDEEFNAGIFATLAREKISQVYAAKKIPIVVGGTGLYIKALIFGLIPAPAGSERLRAYLRSLAASRGSRHLWDVLARLDPPSAGKITPNDSARIIRYLEIVFLTGERPSMLQDGHGFALPLFDTRIACIMPQRQELYQAIDNRVYRMLDLGLVDETEQLIRRGYSPSLRSMQTLAYKHVLSYLSHETGLDEAVSLIQRDTRRYAKRQITWIRAHHAPQTCYDPAAARPVIARWLDDILASC